MELKYKNWNEIPISLWKEIKEVKTDDTTQLNLELLALLCDVSIDDIYSLNVGEINKLLPQIKFLEDFKFDTKFSAKTIVLNGKTYNVSIDLQKFTIAQYIDFQTYWGQKDRDLAKIISCLLIPKGCKYNDGYDVVEVINDIEEHLSITIANSIVFFFLKESVSSIKATLICLEWMTKRKMRKNKEQMMEALNQIQIMEKIISSGLL